MLLDAHAARRVPHVLSRVRIREHSVEGVARLAVAPEGAKRGREVVERGHLGLELIRGREALTRALPLRIRGGLDALCERFACGLRVALSARVGGEREHGQDDE